MVKRTEIVEAARSYVGLPCHPQYPSRGLLLAVAERLGLPHRQMEELRGKLKHELKPGDVVLIRVRGVFACNAIVTEHKGDLCLVRPDTAKGEIVEHILDAHWKDRIASAFELQGLDGEE
jgi:hypothetical protein